MPLIYLDIETQCTDEPPSIDGLTPDGRLKDPAKIQADLERKAEERWRKSSLEPLDGGRVLCIGLAVGDGEPMVLWDDDELATLRRLHGVLRDFHHTTPIVTHNGLDFDLPFLARRALFHGLDPLARRLMPIGKPWEMETRYPDTYRGWSGVQHRARGALDDICKFLGIERADAIDGSQVQERLEAGDLEAIRTHLVEDVRTLRLVHRRLVQVGWMPMLAGVGGA